MGFFDKIFSKEKKTGAEKQAEEMVKENPSYSQASIENIAICNGCGGQIEGTPRLQKFNGKLMYFHKRCFKALKKGQLPKQIHKEE
jgi:hypothetical protein